MKKTKKVSARVAIHKRVQSHARSALIPHATNQFRPHLIRWYGLAAMLVVASIAFASSNISRSGTVLGTEASITALDLLHNTNEERAKQGEPALQYDEKLSSAAYLKAQDMFRQQYWAHNAPDGTTPWKWLGDAGYNYAYAGENLAKNFTTTQSTVAAWMASKHHRENILNKQYSDVGFAVMDGKLDGKQTTLIVALYASPASSVAGAAVRTAASVDGAMMNPIARFGVALQSMTPAMLGSLILLLVGAFIALGAHAYRKQLPVAVRRSWRYHHGLYKGVGLMTVAVVLVALYSGGQI